MKYNPGEKSFKAPSVIYLDLEFYQKKKKKKNLAKKSLKILHREISKT